MEEDIMNSVHIDIVNDKVKIKCDPKREEIPIPVVEEIVTSVIKQCYKCIEKEAPDELVNAIQLAKAWKIVSLILAAIIIGLLIFWR